MTFKTVSEAEGFQAAILVNLKVRLYAKEKPEHDERLPYSELKIISVVDPPMNQNGTKLNVTVENFGSAPAYAFLNYLFYDEDGLLFDGNHVFVSPLGENVLQPGKRVTRPIFTYGIEAADYKVFSVGASGGN